MRVFPEKLWLAVIGVHAYVGPGYTPIQSKNYVYRLDWDFNPEIMGVAGIRPGGAGAGIHQLAHAASGTLGSGRGYIQVVVVRPVGLSPTLMLPPGAFGFDQGHHVHGNPVGFCD